MLMTVLVPLAGSVAGAAGKSKEVSDAKYVKIVCTSLGGGSEAFFADLDAVPGGTDPAAYQAAAGAAAQKFADTLATAQTKLKKIFPADGGRSVAKIFNSYFSAYVGQLQQTVDAFAAADPNGVAFQADVAKFEAAFLTIDATVGDPFSKIDDQDLIGAFKDNKTCKSVVNIYGR